MGTIVIFTLSTEKTRGSAVKSVPHGSLKPSLSHPEAHGVHKALSPSSLGTGLSRWLSGKKAPASAGDAGSVPGLGRSLEKEMAPHSSILAWKFPWMEEPGRLQSMESQRVRHD